MITSKRLVDAVVSATNNLKNSKDLVDSLNIFPVPDGDTGTNMSLTMESACTELKKLVNTEFPVCTILEIVSSAMLRGARGNSGVILSLLFRGIRDGLDGQSECDGAQFSKAFGMGVDAAYRSVMNPTEGTILTVARLAHDRGREAAVIDGNEAYVFAAMLEGAHKALEMSPELLPVLKKAKVVDAGGKGLCLIIEGFLSVFKDGVVISENNKISAGSDSDDVNRIFSSSAVAKFDHNGIKFTYCTEFIVTKKKCSPSAGSLRKYLAELGDCVVVVDDKEIVKVHVHSNNPDLVLGKALEFGELIKVKIENMKEQNRASRNGSSLTGVPSLKDSVRTSGEQTVSPPGKFGLVAVASGNGVINLFKDLGCTQVVEGGQTMNPSTEDIARAIKSVTAETVFVFPNNKNILLAAEQVTELVKDKHLHIVPTKTISQGICALLAFSDAKSDSENFSVMLESIEKVKTGQVTSASRNAEFGGLRIRKGDIMGLSDGKLTCKSKSVNRAVTKLLHSMIDNFSSFVTLIYGQSVSTSDAEKLFKSLQNRFGKKLELSLVKGDQPIYHYIISVE